MALPSWVGANNDEVTRMQAADFKTRQQWMRSLACCVLTAPELSANFRWMRKVLDADPQSEDHAQMVASMFEQGGTTMREGSSDGVKKWEGAKLLRKLSEHVLAGSTTARHMNSGELLAVQKMLRVVYGDKIVSLLIGRALSYADVVQVLWSVCGVGAGAGRGQRWRMLWDTALLDRFDAMVMQEFASYVSSNDSGFGARYKRDAMHLGTWFNYLRVLHMTGGASNSETMCEGLAQGQGLRYRIEWLSYPKELLEGLKLKTVAKLASKARHLSSALVKITGNSVEAAKLCEAVRDYFYKQDSPPFTPKELEWLHEIFKNGAAIFMPARFRHDEASFDNVAKVMVDAGLLLRDDRSPAGRAGKGGAAGGAGGGDDVSGSGDDDESGGGSGSDDGRGGGRDEDDLSAARGGGAGQPLNFLQDILRGAGIGGGAAATSGQGKRPGGYAASTPKNKRAKPSSRSRSPAPQTDSEGESGESGDDDDDDEDAVAKIRADFIDKIKPLRISQVENITPDRHPAEWKKIASLIKRKPSPASVPYEVWCNEGFLRLLVLSLEKSSKNKDQLWRAPRLAMLSRLPSDFYEKAERAGGLVLDILLEVAKKPNELLEASIAAAKPELGPRIQAQADDFYEGLRDRMVTTLTKVYGKLKGAVAKTQFRNEAFDKAHKALWVYLTEGPDKEENERRKRALVKQMKLTTVNGAALSALPPSVSGGRAASLQALNDESDSPTEDAGGDDD